MHTQNRRKIEWAEVSSVFPNGYCLNSTLIDSPECDSVKHCFYKTAQALLRLKDTCLNTCGWQLRIWISWPDWVKVWARWKKMKYEALLFKRPSFACCLNYSAAGSGWKAALALLACLIKTGDWNADWKCRQRSRPHAERLINGIMADTWARLYRVRGQGRRNSRWSGFTAPGGLKVQVAGDAVA